MESNCKRRVDTLLARAPRGDSVRDIAHGRDKDADGKDRHVRAGYKLRIFGIAREVRGAQTNRALVCIVERDAVPVEGHADTAARRIVDVDGGSRGGRVFLGGIVDEQRHKRARANVFKLFRVAARSHDNGRRRSAGFGGALVDARERHERCVRLASLARGEVGQ